MTKALHQSRLALAVAMLLAVGTALGGQTAYAQYAANPFFDYTVELGHAHAAEIIGVRLTALAAFDEVPEELLEETEKVLTREYPRLAGSLQAVSPGLAADLHAALVDVLALAEQGDTEALAPAIARAQQLARAAYAALVPVDIAARPEFVGAIVAKLVLADDGVAESFEEAVEEELWEYPNGWAALQRVKQLWAGLRPLATDAQAFEIDNAIERMEEFFPTVTPPNLQAADPEAGEDPGRQIVTTLEGVVQAFLYPERELGRVAGLVRELVVDGQAAYEAGDVDVALERVLLAQFHYRENLRRLFDLILPHVHAQVMDAFDALSADVAGAGAAAFESLLQALDEGRMLVGG